MLRAGPFSETRIVRLTNRRFVPFYFDLNPLGVMRDERARRLVVSTEEALGGFGVGTPPVLFFTPDGDLVGKIDNFASEERFLSAMLGILKENPEYNRPPEKEENLPPVEKARLLVDLGELEKARKLLLEVEETDDVLYLSGHISRLKEDWKAMNQYFSQVTGGSLAFEIRMERAYELWQTRKYDDLIRLLEGFPASHARYAEARYYLGLGYFHGGQQDDALSVWRNLVKEQPEGPWIYRADWAYTDIVDGRKNNFRIGLLGGTKSEPFWGEWGT